MKAEVKVFCLLKPKSFTLCLSELCFVLEKLAWGHFNSSAVVGSWKKRHIDDKHSWVCQLNMSSK